MIPREMLEQKILEQQDMLYRISISMLKNEADAKDAVHDAILIAYEKIGSLKKPEAFSSWLCRILIRCCYRILRQRSRFVDAESIPSPATSPDTVYKSVEIGQMIESLPPKLRAVFLLYHVEGYSIKEIQSILHIPEGTVKSRLHLARKALKEVL